ncbi:MAG TPA: enoyl-CoA hydratase, partial [Acidimicrobiaceae bacterium]|nr:enoyl-CoA hydratase [Acidimicrobiaceae bacterium]
MPINPDAVGTVGPENKISWTSEDSLLYALGVGAGQTNPTGFELEFTTENTKDTIQQAFPTQVVVLGGGSGVDFGDFNLAALLHGEHHIPLHQTLPA